MLQERTFQEVLDLVYASVLRPSAWTELAQRLSQHFGGPVAICRHQARTSDTLGFVGDAQGAIAYEQYYGRFDDLVRHVLARPGVDVATEADLRVPGIFAEDYLRRYGLRHLMYAKASAGAAELVLGVSREAAGAAFDDRATGHAMLIAPHLARAAVLSSGAASLLTGAQALEAALEQAGSAVMLADGAARIVFSNLGAERIASKGLIDATHERIALTDVTATDSLRLAIARATGRAPRMASSLRAPHPDGDIEIDVLPFEGAGGDSLALLLIAAPKPSATPALAARYRLTPAEARLLAALAAGERLAAYAQRSGIAPSTAKTHLRGLFAKTGANRQVDLMRLAVAQPLGALDSPGGSAA